jgi:death on curing protein
VPEPEWLDLEVVLEIHHKLLVRFGGASGLRDPGLLDSALARPKWLYEFDRAADLHRFASSYAFGIAKNHPFVDGNKRVAFECAYAFLRFHGWHIIATEADVVRVMLALAAGELSEDQMAGWLRENSEVASVPRPTYPSP